MEKALKGSELAEVQAEVTADTAEPTNEVPAALTEVIGEKASADVAKLDKKSQNFVAALYEGVGALDAEDRAWINKSDKISERLTAKIDELMTKRGVLEKEAAGAREKSVKGKEDMEALAKTLQEMNQELSADARATIEGQTKSHETRASQLETSIDNLDGIIENFQMEEKKNREWGESKRQGIDGRLAAKQEINQEAIDRLNEAKKSADEQLTANAAKLKEIDKNIEALSVHLGSTTESVKAVAQKLVGDARAQRQGLEQATVKLQEKSTDLQRGVGSRELANKILKAERDAIWPKEEAAQPDPKEATEIMNDLLKEVARSEKEAGPPDLGKAIAFLSKHNVDTNGMNSAVDMLGAYNTLVNKNTAGKAPPKSIFAKLKNFFGFGAKAESSHE